MPAPDPLHDQLAGLVQPSFVDALHAELAVAAATLAPTIGVTAQRLGVLADTHCASPTAPTCRPPCSTPSQGAT